MSFAEVVFTTTTATIRPVNFLFARSLVHSFSFIVCKCMYLCSVVLPCLSSYALIRECVGYALVLYDSHIKYENHVTKWPFSDSFSLSFLSPWVHSPHVLVYFIRYPL